MDIKAFYKGLYGKPVIHDWVGRVVACVQLPPPRVVLPIQIPLIFRRPKHSLLLRCKPEHFVVQLFFQKKNHFCVMSLKPHLHGGKFLARLG